MKNQEVVTLSAKFPDTRTKIPRTYNQKSKQKKKKKKKKKKKQIQSDARQSVVTAFEQCVTSQSGSVLG